MTLESVRTLLTRRPFEPLRIKTSGREVFEVRHPEMAMLAKSAMVIVHPDANGRPTDRVEYVSYLHITSIETLSGLSAA